MSKLENNMNEIFDLVPVKTNKKLPAVIEKTADNDLDDAYEKSKRTLETVVNQGKVALEDILAIAQESELPRAFEVYSGLFKNVVDANKELLNLQKQIRDIKNVSGENSSNKTVIDKAVFVGSTADLSRMLRDFKNK